jgi:hypothetical protein
VVSFLAAFDNIIVASNTPLIAAGTYYTVAIMNSAYSYFL